MAVRCSGSGQVVPKEFPAFSYKENPREAACEVCGRRFIRPKSEDPTAAFWNLPAHWQNYALATEKIR